MRNDAADALTLSRRLGLAATLIAALAVPITVGALNAGPASMQEQSAPASPAAMEFDVASVKPNKSGEGRVSMRMLPGGGWEGYNITLGAMLRIAYRLQDSQIAGGPGWLHTDRFDVLAKAPAGAPTDSDAFAMRMQALLADRFNLKVHKETREMAVYALTLASRDGKPGARLTPSAVDCTALGRGRAGAPPAPGAPQPGERPMCGIMIGPGRLSGGGTTMAQLATNLSLFVGRIVLDRTELQGTYDFDLEFAPDPGMRGRGPGGGLPPQAGPPPPGDPQGVTIFTAVQEQLGLKLDSQRGPVEVVVIDSAEPPTEN